MARTTKDNPTWVTRSDPANWRGEEHFCGPAGRGGDCDLHVPLSASSGARWCTHVLQANSAWERYSYRLTRDEVRSDYYAPERTSVRDTLTELVKQHRTGGEFDDTTDLTRQHRHSTFAGDYWD